MKESNQIIRERYAKKRARYKRKQFFKIYFPIILAIFIFIYFGTLKIINLYAKDKDQIIDISVDNLDFEDEFMINYDKNEEKDINDDSNDKVDNKGNENDEIDDELDQQKDDAIKLAQEFACFKKASKINSWNLILINKDNKIPDDIEYELSSIGNGHSVDSRIKQSLEQMLSDAKKAGASPMICASFRTYQTQKTLFENKVSYYKSIGYSNEDARLKASYWVAIPNTSEHQVGLALDIIDTSYQKLDQNQENTKTQKWLMENSYKYGFILRYPNDKKDITNINYEPWHYRYVGIEDAKIIYEKNICLEEYIELLKIYNNLNIALEGEED